MKIMTKVFGLLALWVGLSLGNPAQAGIPVIDTANLTQAIQQVTAWAQQYGQMAQQIQQMTSQLQNAQGIRGMGSLVNNPASRNYLPQDYSQILSQGVGQWQAIYDAAKKIDLSQTSIDPNNPSAQLFDQNAKQAALNRASADEAYQSASQRFADIQVLLDKVNQAPDEKDMLDLQGRIQAEQVMMQNEANKLAALKMASDSQRELHNQQVQQMQISSIWGGVPPGY